MSSPQIVLYMSPSDSSLLDPWPLTDFDTLPFPGNTGIGLSLSLCCRKCQMAGSSLGSISTRTATRLASSSDNLCSVCRWKASQAALFSALFSAVRWADWLCRLARARRTAQQVRLFSHERKSAKTVMRNHWRPSPATTNGGRGPPNKSQGRRVNWTH